MVIDLEAARTNLFCYFLKVFREELALFVEVVFSALHNYDELAHHFFFDNVTVI